MNWKELFTYNEDTGRLHWVARPPSHFVRPGWAASFNAKHEGKVACKGAVRVDGKYKYLSVCFSIQGTIYRVLSHRVIWQMLYGDIPEEKDIDHFDGDGQNNKRNNLRIATHAQNMRNMRVQNPNGRGVTQVKSTGKYRAQITVDYKNNGLGYFETPEEARGAYKKAAELHHQEFSGLHHNDKLLGEQL